MERDRRIERKAQSQEMKQKHQENHFANWAIFTGLKDGKYYTEGWRPSEKFKQQGNVFSR